jgi:hypothetical protein
MAIRPIGDTAWWDENTMLLREFLSEWRTRDQLTQWRIENRVSESVLINSLAYLYVNRRVRYVVESRQWGPRSGLLPVTPDVSKAKARRSARRQESRTQTPMTPPEASLVEVAMVPTSPPKRRLPKRAPGKGTSPCPRCEARKQCEACATGMEGREISTVAEASLAPAVTRKPRSRENNATREEDAKPLKGTKEGNPSVGAGKVGHP